MKFLFRGFNAILYKEFLTVRRDPLTLFFMLFPPIVEMIAFGYALDTDVKHIATLVLDEDRTTESRQLIDHFVNTQTFRVAGYAQSITELAEGIRRGRAYVGLQIPPGFTRDLRAGRTARLRQPPLPLLGAEFRHLDDLVHACHEIVHRHLKERMFLLDRNSGLFGSFKSRI